MRTITSISAALLMSTALTAFSATAEDADPNADSSSIASPIKRTEETVPASAAPARVTDPYASPTIRNLATGSSAAATPAAPASAPVHESMVTMPSNAPQQMIVPPQPRAVPAQPALAAAPTPEVAGGALPPTRFDVQKIDNSSIAQWKAPAEKGNPTAQFDLGLAYDKGEGGLERNGPEAVKWYTKASEKGSVRAEYNLAILYGRGEIVSKDDAEAARWYRKAAEQGYAPAQNNLGAAYHSGIGVTVNNSEAVKWWSKAAYERGLGVSKDPVAAANWWKQSAGQGSSDGELDLALAYYKGVGVEKNYNEAYKWANLSAQQGNPEASTTRDLIAKNLSPDAQSLGNTKPAAR